MRNLVKAYQETILEVGRLGRYVEVPMGENEVSILPLVSVDYNFCSAIVLKGGELFGLPHILPVYSKVIRSPEEHLAGMITKIRKDPKEIQAIILASDNLKDLETCCSNLELQVVDFHEGEHVKDKKECWLMHQRDVIVVPERNEVIIHTHVSRIVKKFK